jgi:hypothetical protein
LPDYKNFYQVSKKGAFEILIPNYLKQDKKLNPKASIAFADSVNNSFLMIIREAIPDTEDDGVVITSENYHRFATNGIIGTLTDADIISTDTATLNLVAAQISEVKGEFADLDLFYCITTLRTELYFYQIIGWTLYTNKSTIGLDLRNAALSFKPIE